MSKKSLVFKLFSLTLSFSLLFQQTGLAQGITSLDLFAHLKGAAAGSTSGAFNLPHLRYFSYNHTDNSYKTLVDLGSAVKDKDRLNQQETDKLLTYFRTGLSLKDSSFWVNLRPDSPDQIIDNELSKTDVGKIMLEADLQLKKDTALLTSPNTPTGKLYWDKLYKKAEELFGYQNITIPTLIRPWIVPNEIIIREDQSSAYIYKATVKVMLEEDYLSQTLNSKPETLNKLKTRNSKAQNQQDKLKQLNSYSSTLLKELILPELNKRVNSSKDYAPLRQVYYSLILARWFKSSLVVRDSGFVKDKNLAQLINSQDLTGLASKEPWSKDTYFKAYKSSFEKGEYNIQRTITTPTGQVIRSYCSGGLDLASSAIEVNNGFSVKTDISTALLNRPETVLIQGKPGTSGLEMSVSASPIERVSEKLKEIKHYSGLPISTQVSEVPVGVSDNSLWSEALGVLYFDKNVYRRVESVDITDQDNNVTKEGEITTGTLVDDIDNRGSKINELGRQYDVRTGPYKSIRIGSDLQPKVTKEGKKTEGFLRDKNAEVTPEVYFMHRGVFANKNDILKAFYGDSKLRFDITVIPPAVWGKEYAKTVGHYHFSQEYVKRIGDPKAVADYPEVYQVVSGEVLWLMQKCKINEKTIRDKVEADRQRGATQDQIDKTEVKAIQDELDRGEIEDFIAVRAKAGDIVIMLPGYGHISVNISETEPLVMADWLTWHQKSYYGSFEKKSGAAYYVIKNDQGQPELVLNPKYARPEKTRQMAVKDEIARFGLTRGQPIYNLVNLDNKEFSPKTRFLYRPERFSAVLTPERTLNDIEPAEQILVSSAVEDKERVDVKETTFLDEVADADKVVVSSGVEVGPVYTQKAAQERVSSRVDASLLVEKAKIVKINNKNIKDKFWETAGCRGNRKDPNDFSVENISRQIAGFAEEVMARVSRKADKEILKWNECKPINGETFHVGFAFDSREDSDTFAYELAKVLSAYKGFKVDIIDDPIPTPIAARLTQKKRPGAYDFVFHITPSHNQLQYGGIKLLFEGSVNEHMWTYFFEKRANAKMEYPINARAPVKKVNVVNKLIEEYLNEVFLGLIDKFKRYKQRRPNAEYTIDFMDGSGASFKVLFERLGMEIVRGGRMKDIDYSNAKYVLADGKEVGFAPDPTQDAFYRDEPAYKEFLNNASEGSIYFIIDGDGDRLVTVVKKADGTVSSIRPNQFLPLAGDYILANNLMPEIREIVRTYVTTAGMDALAERYGKPLFIEPVGSKYFNKHYPYAIAGEESGHFVAGEFFDDTIYQALLILDMISETDKGLFVLLDENQKKLRFKGVDKRDDYENISDETERRFIAHLTGAPEEIKENSKKVVDAIVAANPGKELLEALVVVEGEYGIGEVVKLEKFVDSLFTDNPLKLEHSNRGIIVRFKDFSWGGARLSGTGRTGRKYTEDNKTEERRQRISDAFSNVLGLPGAPNPSLSVSSVIQGPGGIDFRSLPIQPMGSFIGADFNLPRLSSAVLDSIDITLELKQIQKMVSSGISPSPERVEEITIACIQKGECQDKLQLCLVEICKFEEITGSSSSPKLKKALMLAELQN